MAKKIKIIILVVLLLLLIGPIVWVTYYYVPRKISSFLPDEDIVKVDNEGHIFAKLTNDSREGKTVEIKAGNGFMQGIFTEYGITLDDCTQSIRNGGFGSTTGQNG